MVELRHLISTDTIEQLRDSKALFEDHRAMHKTKFVKWLEVKADRLYNQYTGAGMSAADAVVKVSADLSEYTAEWKAAAKAKATR